MSDRRHDNAHVNLPSRLPLKLPSELVDFIIITSGENDVHSKHPDLFQLLFTFAKYFGIILSLPNHSNEASLLYMVSDCKILHEIYTVLYEKI